MPNARGLIKSDNNRLIGTFDIDGSAYHLCVAIKPLSKEFNSSNAVLTYSNVEKLFERGSWSGSITKTDFQISAGDGVSITGLLDAPRSSTVRVRGTGMWAIGVVPSLPLDSTTGRQENGADDQYQPLDAVEDPVKLAREKRLLESGDPIIAIFGQSGTGKSTFINLIVSEKQKVGKGLQSCTSQISALEAMIGGKRVVIIDTPGIDDTRPGMSETDILIGIARRLEVMGRNKIWVTGVLFLHRITDNKFSQTAGRISNMLKSLCGDAAMSHLTLCTTMWDKVSQEEGDDRFDELCETSTWKEMVEKGASISLISSVSPTAKADAEKIINDLILNVPPVELAIQDEMISQGKTVGETGAGQVLTESIRKAREEAEREVQAMRDTMREESAAAEEKLQGAIREQAAEVEKLKKLTKEQSRVQQEKAEGAMKELRERLQKESEAAEAKLRAQELEVKQLKAQSETLAQQQASVERIRQQQMDSENERKALYAEMQKESAANQNRLMEAMMAQHQRIEELAKENQRLAENQGGGCVIC